MESNKRKREPDGAVVTFYTHNRTFQRVFKETSLAETKTTVRRKLDLAPDTPVQLVHVQGGKRIDLEDDDDFEAFRVLSRSEPRLEVSVSVGAAGHPPNNMAGPISESASNISIKQKKRAKKHSAAAAASSFLPEPPVSTPIPLGTSVALASEAPTKRHKADVEETPRSQVDTARPITLLALEKARRETTGAPKAPAGSRATDAQQPVASTSTRTPLLKHKKSLEALDVPASRSTAPQVADAHETSDPSKKKRKRKSVSADVEASVVSASALALHETDAHPAKKQKTKAPVEPVAAPSITSTGDTPKKKKKKKTSKEAAIPAGCDHALQKDKQKEVPFPEAESVPAPADAPMKDKKRKEKEKEKEELEDKEKHVREADAEVESTPAPAAMSTSMFPDESHVVKEKRKNKNKKKRSAGFAEASGSDAATTLVAEEEEVPAKAKESKKDRKIGGSAPKATEVALKLPNSIKKPKGKGKQDTPDTAPTQTAGEASSAEMGPLPATDVSPSTTTSEEPAADVDPKTAIGKTSKARMSTDKPPTISPEELLAAAQAAMATVLYRNAHLPAKKPAEEPQPQPTPAQTVPSAELMHLPKKHKVGKSKLNISRQLEDVEERAIGAPPVPPVSEEPPKEPSTAKLAASKRRTSSSAKKSGQGRDAEVSCPVCETLPFHLRYQCPVVVAGAESIRTRIAELKRGAADKVLVEELQALLERAERRASVVHEKSSEKSPAPASATEEAATAEEGRPHKVVPTRPASHQPPPAPSVVLSVRAPVIPTGSEIAEVAVEGQDEGSSNESSDTESESDEHEDKAAFGAKSALPPSIDLDKVLQNVDVETLMRGPVRPASSILARIPSDSSEDEADDEGNRMKDEDAEDDEDEDEKQDRAYRRLSQRLEREQSSSDEDVQPDAASEDEDIVPSTFMDVDPQDTVAEQSDDRLGVVTVADAVEDDNSELFASEVPPEARHIPETTEEQAETEPVKVNQPKTTLPAEVEDEGELHTSKLSVDDASAPATESNDAVEEVDCQETSGGAARTPFAAPSPIVEDTSLPEPVAGDQIVVERHSSPTIPDSEPHRIADQEELTIDTTGLVHDVTTIHQDENGNKNGQEGDGEEKESDAAVLDKSHDKEPSKKDGDDNEIIEPADDLEVLRMQDDDPIELEPSPLQTPRPRNTPPPRATPKPGTIKRMKDRHGRLPDLDEDLPVLASALISSTLAPGKGTHAIAAMETLAGSQTVTEESATRRTRQSTRRSASATLMPPPPEVTPAPVPKRRGRQAISAEEKERKAAEKKAEKEKVAAEKAEKKRLEKEEKDRKREEEKARREEEKAEKARERKERALAKKGGRAQSASSQRTISISGEGLAASPAPTLQAPPSAVKWTTLTQSPSLVEPESSMVDELQPSSPGDGLDILCGLQPETLSKNAKSSEPLFLPSSSQYPERQVGSSGDFVSGDRPASSSESESEVENATRLPQRQPARWVHSAPFRRLSDLQSQFLFPASPLLTLKPVTNQASANSSDILGHDNDDDDDETEESDSDSDAKTKSHIPQERRAGAGMKRARPSGLASFSQ